MPMPRPKPMRRFRRPCGNLRWARRRRRPSDRPDKTYRAPRGPGNVHVESGTGDVSPKEALPASRCSIEGAASSPIFVRGFPDNTERQLRARRCQGFPTLTPELRRQRHALALAPTGSPRLWGSTSCTRRRSRTRPGESERETTRVVSETSFVDRTTM